MEIPFARRDKEIGQELIAECAGKLLSDEKSEQRLENALCEYTGSPYSIAACSPSAALRDILLSYCIGDGDAVFVASFAHPLILATVRECGALPVLCDILPESLTISPQTLEKAVCTRIQSGKLYPRAVIAGSAFGVPYDVKGIDDIATKFGLLHIEDAVDALGAAADGKRCGSLGDASFVGFTTSLEMMGAGQGGAVFVKDRSSYECMRSCGRFGTEIKDSETGAVETIRRGMEVGIDKLSAELALSCLNRYDETLSRRARIASRLENACLDAGLKIQRAAKGDTPSRAAFVALAPNAEKAVCMVAALRREGIEARQYFNKPLHRQSAFRHLGCSETALPVALDVSSRVVSLPIYSSMTDEEVDYMCGRIKEAAR